MTDGLATSTHADPPGIAPAKALAPSIHPLCHLLYGHPLKVKLIDPPTGA
ncbi:MAG: hypothetical protein QM589_07385 [Thermomicrobiales bacterium]